MYKIFSKNNPPKLGFTLVELLVVIVVIAILASIAVVAYSGIQDKAKDSVTQSDLSNLDKKFKLYHMTNSQLPYSENEMRGNGYDGIVAKMTFSYEPFSYASTRTPQGSYFVYVHQSEVVVYFYNFSDKHWSLAWWDDYEGEINQGRGPDGGISHGNCQEKYIEDCLYTLPT